MALTRVNKYTSAKCSFYSQKVCTAASISTRSKGPDSVIFEALIGLQFISSVGHSHTYLTHRGEKTERNRTKMGTERQGKGSGKLKGGERREVK